MPWIVNEDAALTAKLSGLRVTDENAPAEGRVVQVCWIGPELDVHDITYPYIGIESLGWFRDPTREHAGYIQLPYAPEGYLPWWDDSRPDATNEFDPTESPYVAWHPIPYNFDYQVTVFARYERQHLIPIVSQLAGEDFLHPHFGYLNVPQDGTVRSLFVNGGPEKGVARDDNNKRLATATYNIRVCSELLGPIDAPVEYGGTMALAKYFNISLDVYSGTSQMTTPDWSSSAGVLSVGQLSGWNTQ
jgi:hypothetical protein